MFEGCHAIKLSIPMSVLCQINIKQQATMTIKTTKMEEKTKEKEQKKQETNTEHKIECGDEKTTKVKKQS